MIVLAIDLGETTGYAYTEDGVLLHHGTCALGAILPAKFKPDVCVIERPAYVPGRAQEGYDRALAALAIRFGSKVRVVRATDWMARFKHHPLPGGPGYLPTQHEKDAYRMAVWALEKFKEEKK